MPLYIFLFLHQTATHAYCFRYAGSCISSYSYIKPQLCQRCLPQLLVVYLLIPTSNRNCSFALYSSKVLYIFLFLHQTATVVRYQPLSVSCISSYSYIKPHSYIKPQLQGFHIQKEFVVYLLIPTSNRNFILITSCI